MNNKGRTFFFVCLLIVGTALFCQAGVWLIDQSMNGLVLGWLEGKSWRDIKVTLIFCFVINTYLIVLCAFLPARIYARRQKKKQIAYLTASLGDVMKSEDGKFVMSKEYFEIERQLVEIKNVSQRHQQLVQTEMQRKNDLITYLAHDLKTPLASVIGYLSLLDEAPDLPDAQRVKYVGVALKKAYRLEELINEFFDITRFNLQSIVLSVGKINLPFMLRQLADEFYPMLAPEGKQVVVDAPDGLTMTGDADKLARVFNNILKNAVAYSYAQGVIEIHAAEKDGRVTVDFIDRGDPIPAAQLGTIFEKFYRLDSARSTRTGGAGLGLAIAKDIVEAHGGTISVESDLERTKFSVVLPVLTKS